MSTYYLLRQSDCGDADPESERHPAENLEELHCLGFDGFGRFICRCLVVVGRLLVRTNFPPTNVDLDTIQDMGT